MTKEPDANDIMRESGPEGLRLAFDTSRPKPRETKRNSGPRGRLLPIVELVDMSTASRKAWCVHHLLGLGETSIWYGEPGSGKSVLVGDLGLHVAAGRTWHGRQVKQGAVLYVALERAAVVARRSIALRAELALGSVPFALARGPLDLREPQTALDIVTVDLWREYAFKRGIGGQDPDARRKAFKRAVENLASDRLVGMWEPYAWPIA